MVVSERGFSDKHRFALPTRWEPGYVCCYEIWCTLKGHQVMSVGAKFSAHRRDTGIVQCSRHRAQVPLGGLAVAAATVHTTLARKAALQAPAVHAQGSMDTALRETKPVPSLATCRPQVRRPEPGANGL